MGCTCWADAPNVMGRKWLQCKDEYNNLVRLDGCCTGKGSSDDPVMEMCDGMSCSRLEGDGTHCFDNIVHTPDIPKKDPVDVKSNLVKNVSKITETKLIKIIKKTLREEAQVLNESKTCWYRTTHGSPKCKATWEGSGSHGDKCMTRRRCLSPKGGDNIVQTECGPGGYCATQQNCASNEGDLAKYNTCFRGCCEPASKIKDYVDRRELYK